jgi:Polyketide cyclase / dehydrase and lipid transport.
MKSAYSVEIPVSAKIAFDFLANVENEVQWRQSIVGSRYVGADGPQIGVEGETDVSMGSKSLTMRWTIVDFLESGHVAWELDGNPWNGGGSYTVTAQGDGCVVRAALEVRLKGVARILEPLVGLQFGRGLRSDLNRLAALLPIGA